MKLKVIIFLISTLSFNLSFAVPSVRLDLHGMGGSTGLKLSFTPYNSAYATNATINNCVSPDFANGVASNCAGSNWMSTKPAITVEQDEDGNNVNVSLNLEDRNASELVSNAITKIISTLNKPLDPDDHYGYGYSNMKGAKGWIPYDDVSNFNYSAEKGFDAYTFGKLTIIDRTEKDPDTGDIVEHNCNVILATYRSSWKDGNFWEIFFQQKQWCGGINIALSSNAHGVIQIERKKSYIPVQSATEFISASNT